MGLLDKLTNLDEHQNKGLLAAAAEMLTRSGPSRTPTSLGQIVGGGMMAFQEGADLSKRRALQEQEAQQVTQMRGLQIQGLERDMAIKQQQRERMERIRKALEPGAQGQSAPYSHAEAQRAIDEVGISGPGGYDPEALNQRMAQNRQGGAASPAPAPAGKPTATQALIDRLTTTAQVYAAEGDIEGANKLLEQAAKFRSKFSTTPQVMKGADGKLVNVVLNDEGQPQVLPYGVAEKLHWQDTGAGFQGMGEYSGATVASGKKSMAPGEAARLAQDARQFNATHGLARDRLALDQKEFGLKAAVGKAPTEFQGKSAAFGLRATEADKVISSLTGQYSPAAVNSKTNVENWPLIGGPLGAVANMGLSETDQKAEQAQRDFVNAILRQESGAAIGVDEFNNARKQYFPQPGDGAGVIAQKARNRALAIQGLQNNAGRAAMAAPESAGGGWSIRKVD